MNGMTAQDNHEYDLDQLGMLISETRNEPGIAISEVAKLFADSWDKTEISLLIRELKYHLTKTN